jgi:glycosyltransferase involved in cell wall biosynthesis
MTMRILHVVGGMNRGGVETWLMHILRNIDRQKFRMDFLVHTTQPCAYDDEIRALGAKVIPCLHPSRPLTFARNFTRALYEYGPYDVVHSHVHHYSGYVLRLARRAGIPIRIAHSHNNTSSLPVRAKFFRRGYLALTKRWISRHATDGLACSQLAATDLFGPRWKIDARWQILYYGIDLTPFRIGSDSAVVRAELGIPLDAFVVGHVGRFVEQKNHTFLMDIAAEIAKREPKVCFLLVGDGPLRGEMEAKAHSLGIDRNITFVGVRADVPRLMLGAMDVFLFPSLFEGLPLVLLEAQAAGLPCVISDTVPQEAEIVKPFVRRLSLSRPASSWAEALLSVPDTASAITQPQALAIVEKSPFNIHLGVKELGCIYQVRGAAKKAA